MEYKEIREKQLRLFDDPEDEAQGGGRSNVQLTAP